MYLILFHIDIILNKCHDRFRVDNYSAHVLISITFDVFKYLDTTLATENKILTFSRGVLPFKIRSSNVNLALILFFCGHTSYKRVSWKKKGVATRSIPRLKKAWLSSWVMNSYVLSQISKTPVVRSTQFFQNSRRMVQVDREIKSVLVTFVFTEILVIRSCQKRWQ